MGHDESLCLFIIFVSEDSKQLLNLPQMEQFLSFMPKKCPEMQRMGMLANYADPHHRILSDALSHLSLSLKFTVIYFIYQLS